MPASPRRRSFALLSLLLALAFSGCKKNETPVERGDKTQTLELGNLSEPTDLDPQIITAQNDFNIVFTLLEGLTTPDAKDLHPTPGAAQSWEVSPDGLIYTFHLRPQARWSNGDPVTAQDFLYSWRRMLTPALGAEYSYMLYVVKNAEEFNTGKLTDFSQVGFAAPDRLTIQVTLKSPTPYFLSLVAHNSWFPVHQATVEKFGKLTDRGTPWTRPGNYVGNGPFVLKEWRTNQIIRVEKSPTYWDAPHVELHGINFHPIESADTEERAFRAGLLHLTYEFPVDKLDTYRRQFPQELHITPMLGTYFYRLNVKKPPLNDVRVRRALAMSIDRETLVNAVLRTGQQPAFSLIPPSTAGYEPLAKIHEDVPAAQKLLAEAGFPGGQNFPTMTILFNTNEGHQKVAEAIQAMWKKSLGINVNLQNQEAKVYESTMRAGDYQIGRYAWFGDYLDPNTFMTLMISNGGNNQTGWSNPEYDKLIDLAARTADGATRLKTFQQAEGILADQVPVIPIYFYTRVTLQRRSVVGWYSNLLDIHNLKGVHLQPEPPAKK